MNQWVNITAALGFCWSCMGLMASDLKKEFAAPPDAARMWTWWFWLGDKVDRASITADLEAMKAQGVGGVTVYSISGPGVNGKGPDYMSPEWRVLFKHTVQEAERLGLGVSAILCSGWNAGGPWIKPEHACKKQVSSEVVVTGPKHFKEKLSQPGDARFYRDIAIQAFPNVSTKSSPERQQQLTYKLVQASFGDAVKTPIKEVCAEPMKPLLPAEAGATVALKSIIDLTAKCTADGVLEWDVPEGKWTILRTGYTMTGDVTNWSSPTGAGLESDPLDSAAMDFHFANAGAPLIGEAGSLTGKVFRSVQIDSWEMKMPNWSAGFRDDFKKYRSYDPLPYLPALAGWELGDAGFTDRFLYDYRRTVADCVAEHYFGRLTQLAEAKGIIQQSEAGGVCCPKVMSLDALKNLGRTAIPMGEFWQSNLWREANDQNKNGKQTASAGHLYGKPIIAAEAFSSLENFHWMDYPASLKPTADRAFCEGYNSFFIFSSATRSDEGYPGEEFCSGTYFNRKVTWWSQVRAFNDYIARCSHLLRQGLFAADVLFYNGDQCPNFVPPKHVDPALGSGYDYDVCNTEIILTRIGVRNNGIVLPDGMSYRMMVLPDSPTMTVEVLRKLKKLVSDGMTLVGPKPEAAPGLTDYPRCDQEVKDLAAELWGACDGKTVTEHAVGKGRVVWGITPRELLAKAGVKPDFGYAGEKPDGFIDWIHRSVKGGEIYFIANRLNRVEKTACTFRVSGMRPELWDPVTGTVRDLPEFEDQDGLTSVPMQLEPYESLFVVFQQKSQKNEVKRPNFPVLTTAQEITGAWQVTFDPKWGGPGQVNFEKLDDWIKRPEQGIKLYSGTATYRKVFNLPAEVRGQKSEVSKSGSSASDKASRLFLDLGSVKYIARVKLNGKDLGIVWTAPWRVEITGAAKTGPNELEIEVINLWPNRRIGDASLPEEKRYTHSNIAFSPINPANPPDRSGLFPSGLLGPVMVQSVIPERSN
ncbi:MAG: glycosyl hydrolase [Verrucomicrobia bacterium]|nr:glycosyl hydrolase [Verrucomicrobiota bacterium]